jgi:hypothetical protein
VSGFLINPFVFGAGAPPGDTVSTDFSEHEAGAGIPTGWTNRWSGNVSYEVVDLRRGQTVSTDLGEHATGAGIPTGWTNRWSANVSYEVVEHE